MKSGPITVALFRRRPLWTALRSFALLFVALTIALHAPAALDSDDGGPAFINPVHMQMAADADDLLPFGCHHAGHHFHSLCAPPIVLAGLFELTMPQALGPGTPLKGVFRHGRVGRRVHPPPKSLA